MGGFAPFMWLTWLAILVVLVFLAIFLWQKITRK